MDEKRMLLHEILDLVIDINGFEERKREVSGDKPTAFFDFSGHTASTSVRICDHGWVYGCHNDFQYDAWEHNGVDGLKNLKEKLERKKDELGV